MAASSFTAFRLLVLTLCCNSAFAKAVENLDITIDTTSGSYQILLSGKAWFNSGPIAVRYKGECLSNENSSLTMLNYTSFMGEDTWGQFTSTQIWWQSADKDFHYVTYINQYTDLPILGFVQESWSGTTDAATGSTNGIISSFPTFLVEDLGLERAFMTYSGGFASDVHVREWSPDEDIPGGYDGGAPLVVFDSALENTVVISPANTFMSASQATWSPESSKSPAVGLGISGSVSDVPSLYVYKTVLVAGQNITGTMLKWGRLLRMLYEKEDTYRKSDFSINYLGYWTDNGACYYYNTGNYSNYEEALTAVKKSADKDGIPFQYLQIDSWWYYKGVGDGVKNWTAMPSVFPNGIDAVVEKTGWPIMAHNRYWSANTDYAKQNGGNFDFIIDGNLALPNDSSFWQYLLSSSKLQWDLFVYEQDWLLTVSSEFAPIQNDLFLGRDWLMQMGTAAKELDLTIQYCMPWTRHLLQTVEIPVVTQVRASGDYQPQNSQWMIGDTTILAHALGLAAFKDDFHTSENEDGCKFAQPESYPELETYIAALSGGPVGPSDTASDPNSTLILATCMSDGQLLKPSYPAMSVDSSFVYRAFNKDGPSGQLYAGYTEVTQWTWYHILAAEITDTYKLTAAELPPSHSVFPKSDFPSSVAFRNDMNGKVIEVVNFTSSSSLTIEPCGRQDFKYWTIAPLLEGTGMAILGELDKVITVSETRFKSISRFESVYVISLVGAPGETVRITVYSVTGTAAVVTCKMSSGGTAILHIPQMTCGF